MIVFRSLVCIFLIRAQSIADLIISGGYIVPSGLFGFVINSSLTRIPFASAKVAAFSKSSAVGPIDGLVEWTGTLCTGTAKRGLV